jgi:hemolysin III
VADASSSRGAGAPVGDVAADVGAVLDAVRPRLRGWVHLVAFPLAAAAGAVLVALSPSGTVRWASAVFGVSATLLFGTSALYHRGTWSPRAALLLKRLDHSNIFLIIAGTYTPLAVTLLPPSSARALLTTVWVGALLGVVFRVVWTGAPRWLYTPLYVALGWVAVAYLPAFWRSGGAAVVWLVAAGGVLYSLGALVYGIRRPNPSPRWFGFHEVFHVLTVAAFAAHVVAVHLAVLTPRPA